MQSLYFSQAISITYLLNCVSPEPTKYRPDYSAPELEWLLFGLSDNQISELIHFSFPMSKQGLTQRPFIKPESTGSAADASAYMVSEPVGAS